MLEFAKKITLRAGKMLASHYKSTNFEVDYKSKYEPVINKDREVEEFLKGQICKKYPEHGILGEEGTSIESKCEYSWTLDPLDGTINYIRRFPYFTVSIAVLKDNEPYIGVVYNPVSKELFYSQKGNGAFNNGRKIQVSKVQELEGAYLSTGLRYKRGVGLKDSLKKIMKVIERAQVVRRTGSASLDLCNVASGSFDGFFMYDVKKWDIMAGVLLVKEAGGKYYMSEKKDGKSMDVVATNGFIQDEVERILR
ncbi:MAG TPA: inositol monophosphatase family protein [archaeon]|nr:inositol monophosphatase family protein [archaeon]